MALRSLALAAAVAAAAAQPSNFVRIDLPDAVAQGAMCLDGSAPALQFSPGTNKNWVFYHQGGGWCQNEQDCLGRSRTALGSSKFFPATQAMDGLQERTPGVSPLGNDNMVFMPYCDGMSFSGDAAEPLVVNGTSLYFRGHRILEAIFEAARSNLMNATNPQMEAERVVLTGCSAGGLATQMHADLATQWLPTPSTPYFVIPVSGMFLDEPNIDNVSVQPAGIQWIATAANVTASTTNANCIAANPTQPQKCAMAPHVQPFIESKVFAFQSKQDSWSMGCILGSEPVINPSLSNFANGNCTSVPGFQSCAANENTCNPIQVGALNGWSAIVVNEQQNSTANQGQNGAFLTAAHMHCEAQSQPYWSTQRINGVSPADALGAWLNGTTPGGADAFHIDCDQNVFPNPKVQCNPLAPA